MDKYEFLTSFMQAFDELEALKRENADLRKALEANIDIAIGHADKGEVEGDEFRTLDYYALKAGRKALIEKYFYSWRMQVEAKRDENGEIKVTKFDSWVEEAYSRCPDYTSKNLFLKYLEPTLKEKYEKEKQSAIDELIESEQEEQEAVE